MAKKAKKQTLKSLQQFIEKFRAEVATFAKKVVNYERISVAHIPVAQKVTREGVESFQPAGIMVVELMTMAKMAKLQNRVITIYPNYDGSILDVYAEDRRPIPDNMLLCPELQYETEIKRPASFNEISED